MDNEKTTKVIDLSNITTKAELHEALIGALGLPEYYGSNWDALHDMLTGFIPPVHLEIYGAYETSDEIRDLLPVFAAVMADSAAENDGFSYEFVEDVGGAE